MNTLVMLYFLYLELGGVGKGKVSLLALSRYMRKSKSGMKNDIVKMSDLGLVYVYEEFGKGNYKRYRIAISSAGQEHLDNNWESAMVAYRKHVAETIMLMNERNSGKYGSDKKLTKAQVKQIQAGQLSMFGDE